MLRGSCRTAVREYRCKPMTTSHDRYAATAVPVSVGPYRPDRCCSDYDGVVCARTSTHCVLLARSQLSAVLPRILQATHTATMTHAFDCFRAQISHFYMHTSTHSYIRPNTSAPPPPFFFPFFFLDYTYTSATRFRRKTLTISISLEQSNSLIPKRYSWTRPESSSQRLLDLLRLEDIASSNSVQRTHTPLAEAGTRSSKAINVHSCCVAGTTCSKCRILVFLLV